MSDITYMAVTCDECGHVSRHSLDRLFSKWEAKCPDCGRSVWRPRTSYTVIYEVGEGCALEIELPPPSGQSNRDDACIKRHLADAVGESSDALETAERVVLAAYMEGQDIAKPWVGKALARVAGGRS